MLIDHPATAPVTPSLPSLDQVRGVGWSAGEAKRRGIYGFDSRDIRSRPFNLIRSRLLKLHANQGWRLFGVVSATPGVGKSFIATNVAAALSRAPGLQTYLVDMDLRRGSVSRNFGHPVDIGIRSYLEGESASVGDVSFRLADERLIIIPSDRSGAHSAELLAGEPMERLLAAMRGGNRNALFLCDLPPVFANDDAAIAIEKMDGYVMVVEDGRTTKKQIRESLDMLGRAKCAGVVLNRYDGGLVSDSYGYGYGSTKAYGQYFK